MTKSCLAAAALLALTLPTAGFAETSCDFNGANTLRDRVVTVKGPIKKIRREDSGRYQLDIQLTDQCGSMEMTAVTLQLPSCGVGKVVTVTGTYSQYLYHFIAAERIVCSR
jgi:hypothetical protein